MTNPTLHDLLTEINEGLTTAASTLGCQTVQKAIHLRDLTRQAMAMVAEAQRLKPNQRTVTVSPGGVSFGNAWFSHERITSMTAGQLNAAKGITYRAYMDWLQGGTVSQTTPPVPGFQRANDRASTEWHGIAAITTFEDAWGPFMAAGYQYGASALQHVRFGWEIAKGKQP